MLKREIYDALKRFAETFVVMLSIPLIYLYMLYVVKDKYDLGELASYVYMFSCFAYAFWSGVTIFHHEFKDKAFEYLFSLPVSRGQIIITKLLPRFIILLILIAMDAIFMESSMQRYMLLIFFFFALAFLSVAIQSFFLQLISMALIYALFSGMLKVVMTWTLHWGFMPNFPTLFQFSSLLITILLILCPIAISFYFFYRKFDLKPLNIQLRPYLYILLPWLSALAALYFWTTKK